VGATSNKTFVGGAEASGGLWPNAQ